MPARLRFFDSRLWPLFWTQFFGALNDNLFKNMLIVRIAYRGEGAYGFDPGQTVALAGGLFVLPMVLFSPVAGQLADKLAKAYLVRATKVAEIAIMAGAGYGFWAQSNEVLLAVLFLAGVQAAFFGPVKYSLLPESVEPRELGLANAYFEMGSFSAILMGTIGGGLLAQRSGDISLVVLPVILALIGYSFSLALRGGPAAAPEIRLQLNPWLSARKLYVTLRHNRSLFIITLGVSWFWFLGAAILSILPLYGKQFLNVGEGVSTALLALITVGIGLGGMIAGRFSFGRTELGLVPYGFIGLTIFLCDLGRRRPDWERTLDLGGTLATRVGPWIGLDLALVAVFAGLMILPLFTALQAQSPTALRSRIIAGNNVVNAVFMVAASVCIGMWSQWQVSYPNMFISLGALNFAALIFLLVSIPEMPRRVCAWTLSNLISRPAVTGQAQIPDTGAALLVGKRTQFIDWLVLMGALNRDVRFVLPHRAAKSGWTRWLLRGAQIIPMAERSEDAEMRAEGLEHMSRALARGECLCLLTDVDPSATIAHVRTHSSAPVIPFTFTGWNKNLRLVIGSDS